MKFHSDEDECPGKTQRAPVLAPSESQLNQVPYGVFLHMVFFFSHVFSYLFPVVDGVVDVVFVSACVFLATLTPLLGTCP